MKGGVFLVFSKGNQISTSVTHQNEHYRTENGIYILVFDGSMLGVCLHQQSISLPKLKKAL